MAALCRGKHLLVEKPMTTTSEHARQLIDEAARRNRVLLVDHTFVFSPQVDAMRRIVAANDLGRIHYVDAVRGALGSFSAEINVFWDVAVHDLSILLHVFDDQPIAVTTIAGSGLAGCRESFGYMSLRFASGMIAHIHASWLWPVKTRRMTVASDRGFIVYDDTAPDAKIVRYPADFSTVAADAWNEQFRSGMLLQATPVPDAGRQEPLSRLLQHFRDCIVGTAQPCPNGMDALKIIRTLEAADRSLQNNGVQEWL
jgi:predicted dehydrogenase